ncbi:MAG: flagellar protein FliS [Raoultibacter sp.]
MTEEKQHTPNVPEPSPRKSDDVLDAKLENAKLASKKARTKRIVIIVVAILVIVAGAFAVWFFSNPNNADIFDPNAKEGQAPYKTQEEIQAELDRQVEEGMFNISIASVIQFEDGTKPGKAYIENVPGNHYVMQVTITLDDSGETVYESKAIKPGNFIEDITLTKDLDAGSHAATATFTALDSESLEEVGKAAAKINLNVLA